MPASGQLSLTRRHAAALAPLAASARHPGGPESSLRAHEALPTAARTAQGAADRLASHPEQEINQVTSPRGGTIAGLNGMEHPGFSAALIRGIKGSAAQAGLLYSQDQPPGLRRRERRRLFR